MTDDLGRRRTWTDAEKIRVVEESLRGHCQGSATARRLGISWSLLSRWRAEYRAGRLGGGPVFTAVTLASDEASPVVNEAPAPVAAAAP